MAGHRVVLLRRKELKSKERQGPTIAHCPLPGTGHLTAGEVRVCPQAPVCAKHTLSHPTESVQGGHMPNILKTCDWLWKVLANKPEPLTMLFSRFSPSFSFTGSISQGLWLWQIWKEHLRPGVSETDPGAQGGGGQQYQLRDGCHEPCLEHRCPQRAPRWSGEGYNGRRPGSVRG